MKAAFYEREVTPPIDCYVPGHYKKKLFYDVLDKLYTKALVVESGGEIVALVTVDACMVPPKMHDIVCRRIEKYTPIKPENVIISVTHTHTGAPIIDSPEIFCFGDREYSNVLYRNMADCVILAYKRLADVSLKFSRSEVDSVSFNRNYIMKDGSLRTNPGYGNRNVVKPFGEIDPELSVMFFENACGEKIGAIVNFACHLDSVGMPAYSGDYASIISDRLKEIYGKDFISLFILGACGDINHININEGPKDMPYIRIGETLAAAAIESEKSAVRLNDETVRSLKETIEVPKRTPDDEEIAMEIESLIKATEKPKSAYIRAIRNMLTYHATNETDKKSLYVQCVKIGEALIYALPGEVYSWFGRYIKINSPSKINFIATLSNSDCGYIPTREVFGQPEIYETKLCHHSCLVPEAGYLISDKALELAKKI